jgi:hypothetical protein
MRLVVLGPVTQGGGGRGIARGKFVDQPPVIREETVRQPRKSERIGDEVLFHAGRMPTAFADYVQAMRRYSGF